MRARGASSSRDGVAPATLRRQRREWADDRCGGRLVSVLEGGYESEATPKAVVQHLRALAGLPQA